MLKVRRFEVRHSTVDRRWVETLSNQIFQFLLAVLIVKGYLILVNLQKSALDVASKNLNLISFLLEHNH